MTRVLVAVGALIVLTAVAGSVAAPDARPSPKSAESQSGIPRIRIRIPPALPPLVIKAVVVGQRWRRSLGVLAASIDEPIALLAVPEAARALGDLYRRRGYQRLMVNAFCVGVDSIAETSDRAPELFAPSGEWRRYLHAFGQRYWANFLRSYSRPYAANVIDTWLNVGRIAEISNWRAAAVYLRACGL